MITSAHSMLGRRWVAVSSPGGSARHFRVQYRVPGESGWRLCGSFQCEDEAHDKLEKLERDGLQTRLVRFGICPAAI